MSTRAASFSSCVLASCLILVSGCRETSSDGERAPENAPRADSPFARDPAPPSADQPLTPHYEDEDFRVDVERPEICQPEAPFLPAADRERLAVHVRIEAKTARVVPFQPLAFSVEDDEGHRYGATLAGCGSRFENRRLVAPERAEGVIHFDVPKKVGTLRLVYEPFLIGRPPVRAWLGFPSSLD